MQISKAAPVSAGSMPIGPLLISMALIILQTACAPRALSSSELSSPRTAGASYLLGSGDKVRLTLYGDDSFSGEYHVSPDGMVSLPLIGNIPARDRTVSELRDAVSRALINGYYNDPRVSAEIVKFRPFYILGEVNRPGEYPFADELTLDKAVAIAGGYTYRANSRTISLRRSGANVSQRVRVDQTVLIAPGDTIEILERYF